MTDTICLGDGLSHEPKISAADIDTGYQSQAAKTTRQPSLDGFFVVHAIAGRLRIRANDSNSNKLELISQYLQQQGGVTEVISNQQTGSLVINFDENQLSLPQILEILQKYGIAAAESTSKTDIFAEWKSLDFWKEQSIDLIPLFTGLAVTGGLGISGLAAIPVYMLTADTTRWLIDYLKSPISGAETGKDDLPKKAASIDSQNNLNLEQRLTEISEKVSYSIIHTIPGRVRFHMPLIASDRNYARRLERLLKNDAQVTSVRVNRDAGSIAIAFQPKDINISYWVGLMELALQSNSAINSIEIKEQQPLDGTTTSGVWATMKPPSMSYSLAVLANLSIKQNSGVRSQNSELNSV